MLYELDKLPRYDKGKGGGLMILDDAEAFGVVKSSYPDAILCHSGYPYVLDYRKTLAVAMPVSSGKSTLSKLIPMAVDVDEVVKSVSNEAIDRKLKAMRKVAVITKDWSEHNALFYSLIRRGLRQMPYTPSVIFLHHPDTARAIGISLYDTLVVKASWESTISALRQRNLDGEYQTPEDLAKSSWDSLGMANIYGNLDFLHAAVKGWIHMHTRMHTHSGDDSRSVHSVMANLSACLYGRAPGSLVCTVASHTLLNFVYRGTLSMPIYLPYRLSPDKGVTFGYAASTSIQMNRFARILGMDALTWKTVIRYLPAARLAAALGCRVHGRRDGDYITGISLETYGGEVKEVMPSGHFFQVFIHILMPQDHNCTMMDPLSSISCMLRNMRQDVYSIEPTYRFDATGVSISWHSWLEVLMAAVSAMQFFKCATARGYTIKKRQAVLFWLVVRSVCRRLTIGKRTRLFGRFGLREQDTKFGTL